MERRGNLTIRQLHGTLRVKNKILRVMFSGEVTRKRKKLFDLHQQTTKDDLMISVWGRTRMIAEMSLE